MLWRYSHQPKAQGISVKINYLLMLSPLEQRQFADFKNAPDNKFLEIMISQAVSNSLKAFISEVKASTQEVILYNIEDITTMFKVTRQTVNNWRKRGWIIGKRIGKNRFFSREEIDVAISLNQIGNRY